MGKEPTDVRIPEHVPADRVRDFNVYDFTPPDAEAHLVFRAAGREQGQPSTFWSPYNGGHWVVTRAATVERVINDPDNFSNRYVGVPKELNPLKPFRPLQMDPPDHQAYRNLISGALSPRVVATLKADARALTIRLIEGFKARGECEFVHEFALHMPIGIFMSIVGLPESHRETLLEIAERIARPKVPEERMQGYADMDAYIACLIEARRDAGPDDFIGHLCLAEIDGQTLDDEGLVGVLGLIMIAGLDTVAGILGHIFRFLATHPDRRHELIDKPALIPNATEEMLRRFAHTQMAREVRHDLELDGARMKTGDMVVAPLSLFNLDKERFADPLRIDFERPRKPAHIAFGGNAHRCLGAMLARTELQIVLEEWLARIPDFEIRPGTVLKTQTRVTWVLQALPLVWTPA